MKNMIIMKYMMDGAGCFFDAAVLYIFNRQYYVGVRKEIKSYFLIIAYAVVELLSAVIMGLESVVWINISVSIIGLLILSCFYESRVFGRIIGAVLFQFLAIISEMLASVVLFVNMDSTNVQIYDVASIISKIILFFEVILLQLFHRTKNDIPAKYLALFLTIPLLSILTIVSSYYNPAAEDAGMYLFAFSILVINLVSYYLLNILADYIIKESKLSRMKKQIEMQKEKYIQLTVSFKRGNRLLHDVNKHLRYIYHKLEDNEIKDAMKYIEKIDASLEKNYGTVRTGNMVIDAMVSNMQTRLQEAGCRCEIDLQIDVHRIPLEDYDMVIVLGNIIDNQIEAVVQAEHQDIRMAKLSLRMNGNAFLIHAENGKSAKKIARNESEKWFHGLGMKNVMDVLEQYGGSMTTEVQDEWYEMMIMIPICSNL